MEQIFLEILNMSFTASVVILFVLVARLLLKKAPKIFSYALWGVVLFRLVCPFSFESIVSILPIKTAPIPVNIGYAAVPKIDTGIPLVNNAVNSVLPPATPSASINHIQVWTFLGGVVWILGIAALLTYSVITLIRLQNRLKNAVCEGGNIYTVPCLESPFVMGIFKPRIYLPAKLTDDEKQYIILHEQTHIKRFDHIIKIVCFFVLCVHWFNPLVWVAFFVSGRDMEMSCDESVIKHLGSDVKKDYSSSLLTLATGKRIIAGTPLAFGEGDTKSRIKNILNYKKPAFWVAAVAAIAVVIAGIALLTNPPQEVVYALSSFAYDKNDRLSFTVSDKITDEFLVNIEIKKYDENNIGTEMYLFEEERIGGWLAGRSHTAIIPAEVIGSVELYGVITLKDNPQKIVSEMTVRIDENGSLNIEYKPEKQNTWRQAAQSAAPQPTSVTQTTAQAFLSHKTNYLGDASNVGAIISLLDFPAEFEYKNFELKTNELPYGLTINFTTDEETRKNFSETTAINQFRANGYILLALIENLEEVSFVVNAEKQPTGMHFTRGSATSSLGRNPFEFSENESSFNELLRIIEGDIKNSKPPEGFTVKDFIGNDITAEATELWANANNVYSVDEEVMFNMGETGVALADNAPEFNELLNYDEVVDSIFNVAGKRQLESTKIGGDSLLIQKKDNKIYRMGSWKTGMSYAQAVDMQVAGASGNRTMLRVEYNIALWNPDLPTETAFAFFTIAKEGGRWLVEDYIYPEAVLEFQPFFIPDMNEEQQRFNDEYVEPILLSALLIRDWNVGDYSGISPNSVGSNGDYLMYAFEDIMGNENMQPLRIKYQGKYPEKIVEDVLLAHFGFTVEQLHEILYFYYRPQEKIYEYEGGRGGGPIECAVTGVAKHADGTVVLDYVYMTTYYNAASIAGKDAYLYRTSGKLTLKPSGNGGYLYTAVDVEGTEQATNT